MSRTTRVLENKAEMALMGNYMSVKTYEEAQFITNYILTILDKREEFSDLDIKERLTKYDNTTEVTHIGVNTINGMPCITYVLKSEEVKEQFIPYGGTTIVSVMFLI